jgi:hypothetical protein
MESTQARQKKYHLAQLNIAEMRFAADSKDMAEFMNALDAINLLAETSPGFVWRLQDEIGNATQIKMFNDTTIVNMSVWEDRDSLFHYVYKSGHTHYIGRRKEWFEVPLEAHMVLWWVPVGHIPTVEEAKARLMYLRENGPSETAFTFKKFFDMLLDT